MTPELAAMIEKLEALAAYDAIAKETSDAEAGS